MHDKVHYHTIEGQLMSDARKFSQGLETLNFEGVGEETDALLAVRKAAAYPFRAGVSKTIVLVTCSACEEARVSQARLRAVLQDMGISLHVLREHSFEVQDTENPTSSFLFGKSAPPPFVKSNS